MGEVEVFVNALIKNMVAVDMLFAGPNPFYKNMSLVDTFYKSSYEQLWITRSVGQEQIFLLI